MDKFYRGETIPLYFYPDTDGSFTGLSAIVVIRHMQQGNEDIIFTSLTQEEDGSLSVILTPAQTKVMSEGSYAVELTTALDGKITVQNFENAFGLDACASTAHINDNGTLNV